MQTITIHRGDGRWDEWTRCLGGWRRVRRSSRRRKGDCLHSSRFFPADDAEALAAALSQ